MMTKSPKREIRGHVKNQQKKEKQKKSIQFLHRIDNEESDDDDDHVFAQVGF